MDDDAIAVKAWNLLGGWNWGGLPIVMEILGITDIERLVYQFAAINSHVNKVPESDDLNG